MNLAIGYHCLIVCSGDQAEVRGA